MVAVSGSVVTVPLVGSVPLQPPEAVQVCASLALHCKVAGVPMATLLFMATSVTAGFALSPAQAMLVVCRSMNSRTPPARRIPHRQSHTAAAEGFGEGAILGVCSTN